MGETLTRQGRIVRTSLMLAALGLGSCASPVSPTPAVRADFSLPAGLSGAWHGVSAQVISGPAGTWSLEDMLVRTDGTADITEYQGSQRRFVAAWFVNSGNALVIEGINGSNVCRRTGTVEANTMNLRCLTGGRTWSLVFAKQ